jgi:subtilisin family serine protease
MRGAAVVLVALTVAACGGGGPTTPTSAPRRASAPPVGEPCAVTPRAGDHSLHVLARTPAVIVHVPAGLRVGARVPLVLGLQGAGQDARGFEAESGFTQVADEHRFVIAYPMSWRARSFWRYPEPDDPRSGLRYLRATPDAVARTQCVDRGRVDANGVPNGTTLCDANNPGTVVPRSVPLVRNCANGVCALYQWIQGTSMASPHAVGVAALIVAEKGKRDWAHGGLTMNPDKVEQVLRRTATDTPCPAQEPFVYPSNPGVFDATCVGTPAFNGFYGDGVVNALAASKSGGGGRR